MMEINNRSIIPLTVCSAYVYMALGNMYSYSKTPDCVRLVDEVTLKYEFSFT